MTDVKKKITNDFLVYTSATYVTQALGIVTSFAMRFFLEPSLMGVWSLLDLILNYGLYSNLGVTTALYTEMPYHLGKKDFYKAGQIRDAIFSFVLLGAVATGALFLLWAVFSGSSVSPQLRIGIAAVALILVATSIYNFYVAWMWATKKFRVLSAGIVINATLYLLLIFVLVSRFKLYGLLASVFLSISGVAVYLGLQSKTGRMHFTLERAVLWDLLKVSAPLVTVGFVYALFMSLDRLIITRFLGLTALGHYSIALLVVSYANIVSKLLATVVFPNMQEQYGESGSKTEISRFVTKPAMLLAYGSPLLLGAAYLIVPHMVHWILPKYEPGLESMRIFLLGTFFISLCQPIQTYLTTVYKRWQALPLITFGAAVASLSSVVLIRNGWGLNGVAIGMSFGFFAYFTALLFYVFGHFYSKRQALFFYGETLFCFVYYVAVVFSVGFFVRPAENEFMNAAAQLLVFGLCCTPLLWRANKKTGAFSMVWAAARGAA